MARKSQAYYRNQLSGKVPRALNIDDEFLSNQYLQNQINWNSKRINYFRNTIKNIENNKSGRYNKVSWVKKNK